VSPEADAGSEPRPDAGREDDGGASTAFASDAATPASPAQAASPSPADMLLVKGGTFKMGADAGGEGDEHPAHDVTVASFWLDKTEVTQAAYEECVAAKVCTPADPEILATFGGLFRGPQKPVVGISWTSAKTYCTWKGKRLPREAEFERAVRGDDGRRYPWGNDPPTKERTVFSTNAPEEVGTHPAGRGPFGHDDLAGNVWEWIEDDYDPLAYTRPSASEGKPGTCDEIVAAQSKLRSEGKQGFTGTNPIPTECEKSIRGGAYNYPAHGLRSTNRIHHPARFKLRMTGVRCAKDV
jgi:formylglycine-generating enzyme required for sulfatase activity